MNVFCDGLCCHTVLFVCNLTLLGCDRVLEKCFGGPGKVLEFFCEQESGNPVVVSLYSVERFQTWHKYSPCELGITVIGQRSRSFLIIVRKLYCYKSYLYSPEVAVSEYKCVNNNNNNNNYDNVYGAVIMT